LFIPVKDSALRLKVPYATVFLIGINGSIFIYQSFLPPEALNNWLYTMGVVPARILSAGILAGLRTIFTSIFIHGGLLHLIGNMLYLWIFGDNIESSLGHWRFVAFYLLCGFVASSVQIASDPRATLPIVGASGAISGILGAYFIRYPRARIQIWVWLIFFVQRIWVPALYVLGFWFLLQLGSGIGSIGSGIHGGVAWFAHIGGFLTGIVLLLILEPYERKRIWKWLNRGY